jgi:pyruvate formate lyase activating enzyme
MKLAALPPEAPLIGSPFDLRLSMGEKVDETDIRSALESGDWGFIHSFTTGSAVDGPGVRIVAWLTGCQFRCVFCHNPDTWKLINGMPVPLTRAVDVVKQYRVGLRTMKGGLTISGGEPLMQYRFLSKLFSAVHSAGIHTALETNGYLGARSSPTCTDA